MYFLLPWNNQAFEYNENTAVLSLSVKPEPGWKWPRILCAVSTDVGSQCSLWLYVVCFPWPIWHPKVQRAKYLTGKYAKMRQVWTVTKVKSWNKLKEMSTTHRVHSLRSNEAEELLPAASGESFGAPVRKPPLLGLARFVLNGGKDGRIKRLL